MNEMLIKKTSAGIWVVLVLVLLSNFFWPIYYTFQQDSESLVAGSMYYAERNTDLPAYGLFTVESDVGSGRAVMTQIITGAQPENVEISPYPAQIGLQGYVFMILHRLLPQVSLQYTVFLCRGMCAGAMSLVSAAMILLIWKKYNFKLAAAFFLTFFLSPWIRDFAPNMYWVEFTWFIPMLLGLLISSDYERNDRWWVYILIALAIAMKCACGYEYISTIMMGLILFAVVDFFIAPKEKRRHLFFVIFKMGVAALLGFAFVLLLHAKMRGDGSITEGLASIWQNDVLRRTLGGNADLFNPALKASLEASVPEVVAKYFLFYTPVIEGMLPIFFIPLIAASAILFVRRRADVQNRWELLFFIVALLTTLSWFVLAKAHSYEHTHMNYVLWYFGFVQMCIYSLILYAEKLWTTKIKRDAHLQEML